LVTKINFNKKLLDWASMAPNAEARTKRLFLFGWKERQKSYFTRFAVENLKALWTKSCSLKKKARKDGLFRPLMFMQTPED